MSGFIGYFLCGVLGFFIGVVITCILLAKKNLETYQKISGTAQNSLKNNIAIAKGAYKAYLKEELGEGESDSEEDTETEGDDVPDTNAGESEE